MDPCFPISGDLKDSSIARNNSCGWWTCSMLRLRLPPLAHGYVHKMYISAATMSCSHVHQEGFLLTVSAHNMPPPRTPWCYSPWQQVTYCCPSVALGKSTGLVLMLWQWTCIHAGNHSARGNAIPCFLAASQNRWLYCRAGYKVKRRYDLKMYLQYWATKDKTAHCGSWINLPKKVCWIFQWGCEVVSLTTRHHLRFGNPEGFLQQSLSYSSY